VPARTAAPLWSTEGANREVRPLFDVLLHPRTGVRGQGVTKIRLLARPSPERNQRLGNRVCREIEHKLVEEIRFLHRKGVG